MLYNWLIDALNALKGFIFSSNFISFLAVYISYKSLKLSRSILDANKKFATANIKPILHASLVYQQKGENSFEFSYVIHNSGLGPAVIKKCDLTLNFENKEVIVLADNHFQTATDILRFIAHQLPQNQQEEFTNSTITISGGVMDDHLLDKASSYTLFHFKELGKSFDNELLMRFFNERSKLKLHYEDSYGNERTFCD